MMADQGVPVNRALRRRASGDVALSIELGADIEFDRNDHFPFHCPAVETSEDVRFGVKSSCGVWKPGIPVECSSPLPRPANSRLRRFLLLLQVIAVIIVIQQLVFLYQRSSSRSEGSSPNEATSPIPGEIPIGILMLSHF